MYSQSYGFYTINVHMSHKIERHLLLGRKAMMDLDSVLKSRVITLLTKVCRRTLESPLDSKEIKLVHPKGNQP